jgi:hypothetical protein
MLKTVMLVVITAVEGAPRIEIRTSAFCTAIAETPSIPAKIVLAVFGSTCEPAERQMARDKQRSRNWGQKERLSCSDSKPRSGHSKTITNTGTAIK